MKSRKAQPNSQADHNLVFKSPNIRSVEHVQALFIVKLLAKRMSDLQIASALEELEAVIAYHPLFRRG